MELNHRRGDLQSPALPAELTVQNHTTQRGKIPHFLRCLLLPRLPNLIAVWWSGPGESRTRVLKYYLHNLFYAIGS